MTDHPHARISDPISSHVAVQNIARNETLKAHIMHAARRLDPAAFDDTDLLILVEEQTQRRQQRNVIARTRGLMEQDGAFVRVGMRKRSNRETIHFVLPGRLSYESD